MSKYNTDLDYVLLDIDISREELEEIKAEADRIISEGKESKENLAAAYLKKAQCIRKIHSGISGRFIFYENISPLSKKVKKNIRELLEKALELSPDMPEVLVQLGLLYEHMYSIERNFKAKLFFSRAIQLKPEYAAAFNNRAMCSCFFLSHFDYLIDEHEDKGHFEKQKINLKNAITDLTEAIRIRPLDALYHLNRGMFYARLSEHKEAVEDFSNAINYASDTLRESLETVALALSLIGKEYTELKEYSKAKDNFTKSLLLNPGSLAPDCIITLLLRGKVYYLLGEKDKAKADMEEFINCRRKSADHWSRIEISKLIGVMPEDI